MNNNNFRLFSLFSFIVLSWGLSWPITKVGLAYMTPLWYTAARLIVGTVTMTAIVIMAKKFQLPKREDLPLILVVGLLQISIFLWLANEGLAYLPAGRSALLAYTTPLWVMPIATFFFKERSTLKRWIGFACGVLGLIVLMSPWELTWTKEVLYGTAMLLASSLAWAISMIGARYMAWNKSPLELIPWQLMIATIPMIIYAYCREPLPIIVGHWDTTLLLSIAYTGILVTGFSYWGGLIINKELPTIIVSIGFLTVPIFSLLVSAIFMHEAISIATGTSIALILLGLAFVVV